MFMPFVFLLLVATVPLCRGSLRHLADLRLQRTGLALTALLFQIAMTSLPGLPRLVLVGLHLASYATVAFVLWANRRLPGLVVLVAGAASNAFVIALNGGTLPASARALEAAGWADDGAFANSATLSDPLLGWLGDIAATPAWLPFRNVISIGDVLILVGAGWLLHATCHSRLPFAARALCARVLPRRAVARASGSPTDHQVRQALAVAVLVFVVHWSAYLDVGVGEAEAQVGRQHGQRLPGAAGGWRRRPDPQVGRRQRGSSAPHARCRTLLRHTPAP